MAIHTIQPNDVFVLALTGRYLNVLDVSGSVVAESSEGIKPFKFLGGRTIDVGNFKTIELKNIGATAARVDVEINNIKIETNSGGEVSIKGQVSVSDMPPVSVAASATVENGSMQLNEPNVINHLNDVTIPANGIVELVPARDAKGRRVQMSNISATLTLCRIGGAGVTASQGTPLRGSENVPASWLISTRAAIYARNTSGDTAKISLTEFYSND